MAALTVWEFGEPFGADAALERVQGLQEQNLITVRDAAVVDRVAAEFAGSGAVLISTNMSEEQESRLRAAFQQED